MADHLISLDREPLELVENAIQLSRTQQQPRNDQYKRDYQRFSGYMAPVDRDPDHANIVLPKLRSIVETKVPRDVKALIGMRPYIPLEAKRQEFRQASKMQTQILDDMLDKAGFYGKLTFGTRIKTLYGTSFLEALPYYEMITEKIRVPEIIYGVQVGSKVVEQQVPRLRFRVKSYAPWEVYVDPFATGLEEKGECFYVIKIELVRKEEILRLAAGGAYPGLDVALLMREDKRGDRTKADHWGLTMLSDIGLPESGEDDGVGLLFRFESESRYIDVWNGTVVLRDIPNPYKHGMINLSRYVHNLDAHSQNQFWGIGEAKPNEILFTMLDDLENMTFDNHNMANQAITYYRNGAVNPDALVRTVGNKIAIDVEDGGKIEDYFKESYGQPLPAEHYLLSQRTERMIDVSAGQFDFQRGEQSQSDRTATESAMRKEYGDSRQELNVRVGEMICLKSFGEKMLSMIDQFATTDDVIEIVGEQGAQLLQGLNPQDLPGGYNFTFKGANRVANLVMKQRNWKELVPLLLQFPNISTEKLGLKVLEVYEEDEASALEMITPDAEIQQMGQEQHQQEIVEIEQEKQRDHERNLELAIFGFKAKMEQQEQASKLRDNKLKSKPKGATHSQNQPQHDNKSEASHQAKAHRGGV